MRNRTRTTIGAIITFLLAAGLSAGAESESPQLTSKDLERARGVTMALSSALAQRLFAELERSGPLGAIEVCSQIAQREAESLSDDELRVRRVSTKARNPADVPDAWEQEQLEGLQRALEQGDLPGEVVSVERASDGWEMRYLRPVRIMAPCLACHGSVESMDEELVGLLRELYPDDRAVGYEVGDLRGAVSVRLKLGAAVKASDEG